MSDGSRIAGILMVAGPLVGAVCLMNPRFWRVWIVGREEHLALVATHRRSWTMANVGFGIATLLTAAGLFSLPASLDVAAAPRALLVAVAVVYAMAGTLWAAALGIRSRTTPMLAGLVRDGLPTEPAEALVGAIVSGLFSAFIVVTAAALIALGVTLALAGGVAAPIAWVAAAIAALAMAGFLASGDTLPAYLYLPTLVIGIALLVG